MSCFSQWSENFVKTCWLSYAEIFGDSWPEAHFAHGGSPGTCADGNSLAACWWQNLMMQEQVPCWAVLHLLWREFCAGVLFIIASRKIHLFKCTCTHIGVWAFLEVFQIFKWCLCQTIVFVKLSFFMDIINKGCHCGWCIRQALRVCFFLITQSIKQLYWFICISYTYSLWKIKKTCALESADTRYFMLERVRFKYRQCLFKYT